MKYFRFSIKPYLAILLLSATALPSVGELTVASLNPVVSDLARQVGGERVRLIELMKAGDNPHAYTPTPEQLRAAHQAALILAAGKGLETFLPDVRDNLTGNQQILEVGNTLPSLTASHDHACSSCAHHSHSAIDPHWWHSIKNLQRAARIIAQAFAGLDPTDEEYFNSRCRDYCRVLDTLDSWVRKEIYKIPRQERLLTTAHASFGYFCRDYGFTAVPVQGLSTETSPDPQQITAVITAIREQGIKAVFPEKNVNPALMVMIMRETGVKTGGYLLAGSPDPESPTCEAMIRHNVTTIVSALAPEKQ
jgi:zinc/manganese transport system substrate-binding protein